MKDKDTSAYAASGVQTALERGPLAGLLERVRATYEYTGDLGRPALKVGYFANVIRVAPNLGIAIATDGVGTKRLVS